MANAPQPLGLRRSFGFGDRLGLATPGHMAAVRGSGFLPVFAQQSIREMTRTRRAPDEVLEAAQRAVDAARWTDPWGADADHLKTPEDMSRCAAAGFTMFTIDPSEHVDNQADSLGEEELNARTEALETMKVLGRDWQDPFLCRSFDVGLDQPLRLGVDTLKRAAVKYGRAIQHCVRMARAIALACGDRPVDIEVSVDETDCPTSPEEHLFFGLELQRCRVPVTSLAPRFIGEFEKGIDYRGDLARFEDQLRRHVAVARHCGPYKISIHSGSDKFAVYPAIGRACGDALHVKTAGTSYLEALRVVCRAEPALFLEIVAFARGRFATDRASYHISTTDAEVASMPAVSGPELERVYLDERVGRQVLHVTFGSVLTLGQTEHGRPFRDCILEVLQRRADLHAECLVHHLGRHLKLLNAG